MNGLTRTIITILSRLLPSRRDVANWDITIVVGTIPRHILCIYMSLESLGLFNKNELLFYQILLPPPMGRKW